MTTWILSTAWIKKATLQQEPHEQQISAQELQDLSNTMGNLTVENKPKNSKSKKASQPQRSLNDDGLGGESEGSDLEDDGVDQMADMDKFMEDYSDDEEIDSDDDSGAAFHKYLQQSTSIDPDVVDDEHDLDDNDEDDEDNRIDPNASIFLTGQTNPRQDDCFIEVQVYNNESAALYTHHDIQVPAPPIALAPLTMFNPQIDKSKSPQQLGAFVAVGMMAPGIEIWDLDTLHPVEPALVLGGFDFAAQDAAMKQQPPPAKGTKSKKVAPPLKPGSHSDNITSLSWSPTNPDALLSASADKTVKLWQISTQLCAHTFTNHSETVSLVQINPLQPQYFLSASESGHVAVIDLNSKQTVFEFKPAPVVAAPPKPITSTITINGKKKTITTQSKSKTPQITLETARWNNVNPNLFYVTLSNGIVQCFDIRSTPPKPTWQLNASQSGRAIPSIAPSTFSETLFATVGEDGVANVWDLPANHPHPVPQPNDGVIPPALLTSRDLAVGRLFSASFDINNPFVLGAGGDGGCPAIWDLMENMHVNKRYQAIVQAAGFGDQTLPEDYIQQQMAGIQSKGIGPGKQAKKEDAEDYDSDDDYGFDDEDGEDGEAAGFFGSDDDDEGM